jgi:hypothetical protein
MKRITSKIFQAQLALSRQRFKLVKRLEDSMYERSPGIPELNKKRLLDQNDNNEKVQRLTKKLHRKKTKMDIALQSLNIHSRQHKDFACSFGS